MVAPFERYGEALHDVMNVAGVTSSFLTVCGHKKTHRGPVGFKEKLETSISRGNPRPPDATS